MEMCKLGSVERPCCRSKASNGSLSSCLRLLMMSPKIPPLQTKTLHPPQNPTNRYNTAASSSLPKWGPIELVLAFVVSIPMFLRAVC